MPNFTEIRLVGAALL